MKIPIGILALIVAPLLSDVARAQPRWRFTTTFSFAYTIAGVSHPASFPTSEGKRLLLPIAFDRWNCTISDIHLSDDGLKVFHNLACLNLDTAVGLGTSAVCPTQATGSDSAAFFLVVPNAASGPTDTIRVDFEATCATRRLTAPTPAPVKNL
jgi:hypothetical protein